MNIQHAITLVAKCAALIVLGIGVSQTDITFVIAYCILAILTFTDSIQLIRNVASWPMRKRKHKQLVPVQSTANILYYINNIADNLRTPLNVLLSSISKFGADKNNAHASSIYLISYIMHNLLFYEKIIGGNLDTLIPYYTSVNITSVIVQIVNIINHHYDIKHITYTVEGRIMLTIEENWIKQIILNLIISNLRYDEETIHIHVATSTYCTILIEMTHGENLRDSREMNMYAFINDFIINKLNITMREITRESLTTYELKIPLNAVSNVPIRRRNPIHGIVCDDVVANAKALSEMLVPYNVHCTICRSGEEMVTMYKRDPTKYMFILSDLVMLGIDGIEAIRQIKQFQAEKNIPYIIAICMTGDITQHATYVFDEIVYKPINELHIMTILDKHNVFANSPLSSRSKSTGGDASPHVIQMPVSTTSA